MTFFSPGAAMDRARKRISLVCTRKPDARFPEWEGIYTLDAAIHLPQLLCKSLLPGKGVPR